MNGENNNPIVGEKLEEEGNKQPHSILGALAVHRIEEPIPEDASERVEQAKALVAGIREICEAELAFHELIIKGLSNHDDDNEPDIKLVWGGRPFPIYEHSRTAPYVDAEGNQYLVMITMQAVGSYALRADAWPPTNADAKKEQGILRKFKKNIQKKQIWGMNIAVTAIKDTRNTETDELIHSEDTTTQDVFTLSFRTSDTQSIFRSIDADDLAQLHVLADLIKNSSHA